MAEKLGRFYADTHGDDEAIFVFDQKGEKGGCIDSEHDGPFETLEEARARAAKLNELLAERQAAWEQLQAAGGRGVELAEKIDELDRLINEDAAARRLRIATELIEEIGSPMFEDPLDPEYLAKCRYAVVFSNSGRTKWIHGADSEDEVASHHLGCLLTDSDDAEWVEDVIDMNTGEPVGKPGGRFVLETWGDGHSTHAYGTLSTPNGYDRLWIAAINGVLEDRESGVRVRDLDDDIWARLGAVVDHLEDEQPDGLVYTLPDKEKTDADD